MNKQEVERSIRTLRRKGCEEAAEWLEYWVESVYPELKWKQDARKVRDTITRLSWEFATFPGERY